MKTHEYSLPLFGGVSFFACFCASISRTAKVANSTFPLSQKKWLFITEQNAAMVRYFDYFSLEFVVFRMNTEHVTRLYAGVNFRIHSIFKDISIRSE